MSSGLQELQYVNNVYMLTCAYARSSNLDNQRNMSSGLQEIQYVNNVYMLTSLPWYNYGMPE